MAKPTVPNPRGAVVRWTYDHVRSDVNATADDDEGPRDAEANRNGTVAGRVVDSKGVAVPDAMVLLLNVEPGASAQSTMEPATAQTDAQGCFRFESLTAGSWLATASGPLGEAGHGGGANSGIIRLQGDEVRTIELVLGYLDSVSGTQVAGVVTDHQGRPLADAEVTITVSTGAPGGSSSSPASSRGASTDPRGRFKISALPHGPAMLVATHADYRDGVREFTIGPEPNEVSLALKPGLKIAGSIRSSSGAAIPLAWIVAIPDLFADRWPGSSGMVEAQADRNGDYRLKGLNAGVYELTVSAEGYAKSDVDETVRLDERSAVGVDIVLQPEARVTVCVTSVSRAGIQVHAVQGNAFREAQSTEAGEYRIGNLPPGDWIVSAVDDDGETVQQAVALSPGDDAAVELHFEPGVLLTGQITVAGRTANGGTLALNRLGGATPRWSHMDRKGRFEVVGLQPGIYLALIAVPAGAVYRRRIELRENRHLLLDLEPHAALAGRVVSAETGQPLAEAFVGTVVDVGLAQPLPGSKTTTAADGRFELRPAPGTNEIVVNRAGFEEQRREVELAPAEHRQGLVFELRPGKARNGRS
ncbi:MAG: carboxypeptidase regulatory-like domain-containing protein [Acidobacteria bacterium]|nr:carboxypeptidase regulatory-like domain-containing protein [Acidobacteriota bacterium]